MLFIFLGLILVLLFFFFFTLRQCLMVLEQVTDGCVLCSTSCRLHMVLHFKTFRPLYTPAIHICLVIWLKVVKQDISLCAPGAFMSLKCICHHLFCYQTSRGESPSLHQCVTVQYVSIAQLNMYSMAFTWVDGLFETKNSKNSDILRN